MISLKNWEKTYFLFKLSQSYAQIARLLFNLELYENQSNKPCTSKPCTWNKPLNKRYLDRQYTTFTLHTAYRHCTHLLYTLYTILSGQTIHNINCTHCTCINTVHIDCTHSTQHYLNRLYTTLTLHTVHLHCTHWQYTLYTPLSGQTVHIDCTHCTQHYLDGKYTTLTLRTVHLHCTHWPCTLYTILSGQSVHKIYTSHRKSTLYNWLYSLYTLFSG